MSSTIHPVWGSFGPTERALPGELCEFAFQGFSSVVED